MTDLQIELVAVACHEANRSWCLIQGDTSQRRWEDAEPWQRQSAIAGVKFALHGSTPRKQHDAWCATKIHDGWVYGPVKDAQAKTHPCLVEYDELPPEQKAKDKIFLGVVRAFQEALDAV